MKPIRQAELYVTGELMSWLRLAADLCGNESPDEYAEAALREHLLAMYPELPAILAKANTARRKILEDARKQLEPNLRPVAE